MPHWEKEGKFSKVIYKQYAEYLEHQVKKLGAEKEVVKNANRKVYSALKVRLPALVDNLQGKTCLCLGARLGGEVVAFLELGCFAIGIDINPGETNKYVLHGDFHKVQFPNKCVDIVYTNCLDHVFEMKKVVSEMHRLIKNTGQIIVDIVEGTQPGNYESLWWNNADDVSEFFIKDGLSIAKKVKIDSPWNGYCYMFK